MFEKYRVFSDFRGQWHLMTAYQRFERIVALILSALVALIISAALWGLAVDILHLLRAGALDRLTHSTFQAVFGTIMTVLIAMEFNHTILHATLRRDHVIEVKTVVLIGILALARKFIILEPDQTSADTLAALALSVLVLGATYWLIAKTDKVANGRRAPAASKRPAAPVRVEREA